MSGFGHKKLLISQVVIIAAGALFLTLAVFFNLPATNDESLVGLKGIMFMILFVINTSSHSLFTSEFYYINNGCLDKSCGLEDEKDRGYRANREADVRKQKNNPIGNILVFNIFILNSSYFLIFSILLNIAQATGIFRLDATLGRIMIILSFYSFLVFLAVISINYLLYNFLLYSSLKKIIEKKNIK